MQKEIWRKISDNSRYEVSSFGRFRKINLNYFKRPDVTRKYRYMKVVLMLNGYCKNTLNIDYYEKAR